MESTSSDDSGKVSKQTMVLSTTRMAPKPAKLLGALPKGKLPSTEAGQ
jgi:hypothetical protein